MKLIFHIFNIAILALATGITAQAEPKTSDGGAAIKKAQGLIRQLSQEKSALEAEKNALLTEKNQLADKLKETETVVKKLEPLQAEVERYKTGLETVKTGLESQLGQERQRQQALLEKHNAVVGKANAIFADNQLLVQAVQERETWIKECGEHNQALRQANLDILARYKEKGLFQQLVELEPFTGIGQIQTETVAEDYRYKLQQLKITPFKPSNNSADAAETAAPETAATGEGQP